MHVRNKHVDLGGEHVDTDGQVYTYEYVSKKAHPFPPKLVPVCTSTSKLRVVHQEQENHLQ